jgi:hypothetical protein
MPAVEGGTILAATSVLSCEIVLQSSGRAAGLEREGGTAVDRGRGGFGR